ncbi:MAG TPA: thiamine pyrophosphate-dependent enzyme [Microbacteriaceae bacterium]|nr:thiamine pyrophosphate-dependent enzyme [Microbacteriaceae bacterium]
MRRIEALRHLAELGEQLPLVVTCAATSRELASIADRDNHLYLLDAMGLVGSVATGIAIGIRDSDIPKVVGIEGDGSLLMNPNVLPTGGYLAPSNLLLVVLDNHVYSSTAGLPTYADRIDLARMAEATGWTVARADDADGLRRAFAELLETPGPCFLHVRTEPGNEDGVPKLLVDPVVVGHRFSTWLQERLVARMSR